MASNQHLPSLRSVTKFKEHDWIKKIEEKYTKQAKLSAVAIEKVQDDLFELNELYIDKHGRTLFTSVDGRVKTYNSVAKKLFDKCKNRSSGSALTKSVTTRLYNQINDIAGVRFALPYFDEVVPTIEKLVRPYLANKGYGVRVNGLRDKDTLDQGDDEGYRSYHFFINVPTPIDIYDTIKTCLVEVQARTELQHVWAVKSHNLLYKPSEGWVHSDRHVREDMKQVSNSLRSADQHLCSIRDRIDEDGNALDCNLLLED